MTIEGWPRLGVVLCAALLAAPSRATAESAETVVDEDAGEDEGEEGDEEIVEPPPAPRYETVVRGAGASEGAQAGRAASTVSRRHIEERLPRSAPDALRYEPGAFVQQTAHGQASTFIRGLTGQQTVLLFDGIRLNNSTYRQGPNQYFFTVDSRTVSSIEVVRGSSSVLYGSDALGGVIVTQPLDPRFRSLSTPFRLTPRTTFRLTTADGERGGALRGGGAGP